MRYGYANDVTIQLLLTGLFVTPFTDLTLANHFEIQLMHNYIQIVSSLLNGPLARYAKWRVAHALGMLGTVSPAPRVNDPDMHHGTCVTHVPWYMPGSLTGGFLWSPWWGKHSRHSRRMRNLRFYVSFKRPMADVPDFCGNEHDAATWECNVALSCL